MTEISMLTGNIIKSISGMHKGSDEIIFTFEDGRVAKLYHRQQCCEAVFVEDICGDVEDITGSMVCHAEKVQNHEYNNRSETWTFFKISTIKGGVTIRWYGSSNGYYSEDADFSMQFPSEILKWHDHRMIQYGAFIDEEGFHFLNKETNKTHTISSSNNYEMNIDGDTSCLNNKTIDIDVQQHYQDGKLSYVFSFYDIDDDMKNYRLVVKSKNNKIPEIYTYMW
jgi:hypothetical protein